jgi:hypothetical protein
VYALMTRRRQLPAMLTAARSRLEHAVGPIRRGPRSLSGTLGYNRADVGHL